MLASDNPIVKIRGQLFAGGYRYQSKSELICGSSAAGRCSSQDLHQKRKESYVDWMKGEDPCLGKTMMSDTLSPDYTPNTSTSSKANSKPASLAPSHNNNPVPVASRGRNSSQSQKSTGRNLSKFDLRLSSFHSTVAKAKLKSKFQTSVNDPLDKFTNTSVILPSLPQDHLKIRVKDGNRSEVLSFHAWMSIPHNTKKANVQSINNQRERNTNDLDIPFDQALSKLLNSKSNTSTIK
jgi:hypothetical protein